MGGRRERLGDGECRLLLKRWLRRGAEIRGGVFDRTDHIDVNPRLLLEPSEEELDAWVAALPVAP